MTYTYTGNSKLETRNWSRGLITTYSYDPMTGELTEIDYNDTTPDVSFAYDRLGRQKTVTDALGTRTFTYNSNLQLESETVPQAFLPATNILTRSYDSLGRPSGFTLDSDYAVSYDYNSYGRMNSVSLSVSSVQSVVNYSYLQDSDLIQQLTTDSGLLTTRSYEDHRNLITQVKNQFDSETISRYDYANDAGGRRTSVKHSGTAFDPVGVLIQRLWLIDLRVYLGLFSPVFEGIR